MKISAEKTIPLRIIKSRIQMVVDQVEELELAMEVQALETALIMVALHQVTIIPTAILMETVMETAHQVGNILK